MSDDEWFEIAWRLYNTPAHDPATWVDMAVPDEHPWRGGCLRVLLAAALLVCALSTGVALGWHAQRTDTRFVSVDPPSAVVDIRP